MLALQDSVEDKVGIKTDMTSKSEVDKGNDNGDTKLNLDEGLPEDKNQENSSAMEDILEQEYSKDPAGNHHVVNNKEGFDYSEDSEIESDDEEGMSLEESDEFDSSGDDYADNSLITVKNVGDDYDHIDPNENREIEIEEMIRFDVNDTNKITREKFSEKLDETKDNDYSYDEDSYHNSKDVQIKDEFQKEENGDKDKFDTEYYDDIGLYEEYGNSKKSDEVNDDNLIQGADYRESYEHQQEVYNNNMRNKKGKNKNNDFDIGLYETYYDQMDQDKEIPKEDNSYKPIVAESIENSNDYSDYGSSESYEDDFNEYSVDDPNNYSDTDSSDYSASDAAADYEEDSVVGTESDSYINYDNKNHAQTPAG